MAGCYTKLAVLFPTGGRVDVVIANTHYAYPRRDGQAELAWAAGLNRPTKTVCPRTVTHSNGD